MLCTIAQVAAISGFGLACPTCNGDLVADQLCRFEAWSWCKRCQQQTPCKGYEVVMQVVNHDPVESSEVVRLNGDCLQQLFGIPPSKLHRYLARLQCTEKMLLEALRDMLVGQSALFTPSTRTITVEMVGGGAHTILSYLPLPTIPPLGTVQGSPMVSSDYCSQTPSRTLPLLTSPPSSHPTNTPHPSSHPTTPQLYTPHPSSHPTTPQLYTPHPSSRPTTSQLHAPQDQCVGATPEMFAECSQRSPELFPLTLNYSTPLVPSTPEIL